VRQAPLNAGGDAGGARRFGDVQAAGEGRPPTRSATRDRQLPEPASLARHPSPTECLPVRNSEVFDNPQNPLRRRHFRTFNATCRKQNPSPHETSRLETYRAFGQSVARLLKQHALCPLVQAVGFRPTIADGR
jgi:hypothetical protein